MFCTTFASTLFLMMCTWIREHLQHASSTMWEHVECPTWEIRLITFLSTPFLFVPVERHTQLFLAHSDIIFNLDEINDSIDIIVIGVVYSKKCCSIWFVPELSFVINLCWFVVDQVYAALQCIRHIDFQQKSQDESVYGITEQLQQIWISICGRSAEYFLTFFFLWSDFESAESRNTQIWWYEHQESIVNTRKGERKIGSKLFK